MTAKPARPTTRRASAIPLGKRIRRDIETRILSGDWAPGFRIPFEHELMQKYGCARMTVSKALAQLAENGLIERRRRAGSFVRSQRVQSAVLEIPNMRSAISELGQTYSYQFLRARVRKSTAMEHKHDGLPRTAPLLEILCLHLADATPYAYEERRILLDAVPKARHVDFRHEPPGQWLLCHIPWHEAEHKISAVAATPELIELLDLEPGAACLKVERSTWLTGTLLTTVRFWYPGSSQTLVARFTPLLRPPAPDQTE